MDQQGQMIWRGATALDEDDAPLRVPKTAELVAAHLREQIISGALPAGEHLPPEATLTAAFNIARPTLREAIRILESEGLLAVSRGARTGARVLRPGLAPLVSHCAMLLRHRRVAVIDLAAALHMLERAGIAEWCGHSERRTLAPLHTMLAAARRALALLAFHEAETRLDRFALLLAERSDNITLAIVAAMLSRLVTAQDGSEGESGERRRERLTARLRAGERLLALIAAGDTDAAVAHWQDHQADERVRWSGGAEARVVELPPTR